MDIVWKAKWIAALTSGEYEQGKDWLRTKDNKFCCLGVFCNIYDGNQWKEAGEEAYVYNGCFGFLPSLIKLESGIDSEQENKLVEMNDNGESFEKIAEYIKENL